MDRRARVLEGFLIFKFTRNGSPELWIQLQSEPREMSDYFRKRGMLWKIVQLGGEEECRDIDVFMWGFAGSRSNPVPFLRRRWGRSEFAEFVKIARSTVRPDVI